MGVRKYLRQTREQVLRVLLPSRSRVEAKSATALQYETDHRNEWLFHERSQECNALRSHCPSTIRKAQVTIICLVYKSVEYAAFFIDHLEKVTPELQSGEAELLMVANDATDDVKAFIRRSGHPFLEVSNTRKTLAELNQHGYAWPEYISRVYRGYNSGIRHSDSREIVLMNSDNFPAMGWLYNLRKRLDRSRVVSPLLVQPHSPFPNPINHSLSMVHDFGGTLNEFRAVKQDFINWAEKKSKNAVCAGNPFMPVLAYKWQIELVGYFPEGNIAKADNEILLTGDTLFFKKLGLVDIHHISSCDSIVYHLHEGERHKK